MHVDPLSTDAFNALFRGHKWWVYLPSDLYEFEEELTCDESCSDFDEYEDSKNRNEELMKEQHGKFSCKSWK